MFGLHRHKWTPWRATFTYRAVAPWLWERRAARERNCTKCYKIQAELI